MYRVAIIGSGGREHAIAAAIKRSPKCSELFCLPGNPGMAKLGSCVSVSLENLDAIVAEVLQRQIHLVIIGPEKLLADELADKLRAEHIPTFGPNAAAALLESNKVFAHQLAEELGIRQPKFSIHGSYESALDHLKMTRYSNGVVVKANGLAQGKGVIVCDNIEEAIIAAHLLMVDRLHGDAGKTIIIEERIRGGQEVSLMLLVDGQQIVALPPAQDFKAAFENDEGPNTGGMGALAPVPFFSRALVERAMAEIAQPVIQAMAAGGIPFRGCLYLGLMLVPSSNEGDPDIYLLEFNTRLGDPEAQVVLPILHEDFLQLAFWTATGSLPDQRHVAYQGHAVAVTLASPGYPSDSVRVGHFISGVKEAEQEEGVQLFYAGTRIQGGYLQNAGGRVLTVVGTGAELQAAREAAYRGARHIHFEGMRWRSDIAKNA